MKVREDLKRLPEVVMTKFWHYVSIVILIGVIVMLPTSVISVVISRGWAYSISETIGILLGYPMLFVVLHETFGKLGRAVVDFPVEKKVLRGGYDYEQFYLHSGNDCIEVTEKMFDSIKEGDICYIALRSKDLKRKTPPHALKILNVEKIDNFLNKRG